MTLADRQRQIVDIAAQLFDRAGYANATMDDIGQAAGIAKATLYHYFDSKNEILAAIHEVFIDLLLERARRRERLNLTVEQQLFEIMFDILELMETHRGHVRVFFEYHRELRGDERREIRVKRDEYERLVTDVIAEGVHSGKFRSSDPRLTALSLFGMCNWAYQWYRNDGSLKPREIAYQFWTTLLHGISESPSVPSS